jgi:hypothetical protein
MQAPLEHVWHAAHLFPHVPQLFGSLLRLVQNPPGATAVWQQSGVGAAQVEHKPVAGLQL